jgi:hypothetical protein
MKSSLSLVLPYKIEYNAIEYEGYETKVFIR